MLSGEMKNGKLSWLFVSRHKADIRLMSVERTGEGKKSTFAVSSFAEADALFREWCEGQETKSGSLEVDVMLTWSNESRLPLKVNLSMADKQRVASLTHIAMFYLDVYQGRIRPKTWSEEALRQRRAHCTRVGLDAIAREVELGCSFGPAMVSG